MLLLSAQTFAIPIAILTVRYHLSFVHSFIHSNQLIFLLEIKVLTINHSINIPYKVLKLYSDITKW